MGAFIRVSNVMLIVQTLIRRRVLWRLIWVCTLNIGLIQRHHVLMGSNTLHDIARSVKERKKI